MKKQLIFLLFISFQANSQIINTIAGTGVAGYNGNGMLATASQLLVPAGVVTDHSGNVYISDTQNNRVRKVNAFTGIISTIAGTGVAGFSGDGGLAVSAQLSTPYGLAIDAVGNIYIGDVSNYRVRKINIQTGIITTIAGIGSPGYNGDGIAATAASLWIPTDIDFDAAGNIYIADAGNERIRKINKNTGIITTVAGTGAVGYGGDGGAAIAAKFDYPYGIAIDASSNIYVADWNNSRVRKINASTGKINTIAGTGVPGFSGDGSLASAAQINRPYDVDMDAYGNIYFSDWGNERIRKINKNTGIINTIAGDGTPAYGGDGGLATLAQLWQPSQIEIDASCNVYVADYENSRIRKITGLPAISVSDSVIICAGSSVHLSAAGANTYSWHPSTALNTTTGATVIASPISSVTYTVTGNIGACSSTDSVKVIVHSSPTIHLSTDHNGDSTVLIASGGNNYLWNTNDTTNSIAVLPIENTTYCVSTVAANGCRDTACTTVVVKVVSNVFIPNAFTPNNNNLNDVFKPSLIGVHNYNFLIVDRWGEIIFQTSNPQEGWDGKYKGTICEEDIYVYKITFDDDAESKSQQYIGRVALLR